MKLICLDSYRQKSRIKVFDDVIFCSLDLLTIHQLKKTKSNYIDLLDLDCVNFWGDFSNQELGCFEYFAGFVSQYNFAKGHDVMLFSVTYCRAAQIAEELVSKYKIDEFIYFSYGDIVLQRTGPAPFEKASNRLISYFIADILERNGVKITQNKCLNINIKKRLKSIISFKLNLPLTNVQENDVVVLADLLYSSEIEVIKSLLNNVKVTTFKREALCRISGIRFRASLKSREFKFAFLGSRTKRAFLRLIRSLIEEEETAEHLFERLKTARTLVLGHDGFALESKLSKLMYDDNKEIISFSHYGIGYRQSLRNIDNAFSKKVLWNEDMKSYINTSAGTFPTDTIYGTKRYNVRAAARSYDLLKKGDVQMLIITSSPNLGLFDFSLKPRYIIENFRDMVFEFQKYNWTINVRNHPSYDYHEFYSIYSGELGFTLDGGNTLQNSLNSADYCVLFASPSSVLIESVLANVLVLILLPDHSLRNPSDINISLKFFPLFRDSKELALFIANMDYNSYYNLLLAQQEEVRNFVGQ